MHNRNIYNRKEILWDVHVIQTELLRYFHNDYFSWLSFYIPNSNSRLCCCVPSNDLCVGLLIMLKSGNNLLYGRENLKLLNQNVYSSSQWIHITLNRKKPRKLRKKHILYVIHLKQEVLLKERSPCNIIAQCSSSC